MPPFLKKLLVKFGVPLDLVEEYKGLTGSNWIEILIKVLKYGPELANVLLQLIALFKSAPVVMQATADTCCDELVEAAEHTLLLALKHKVKHLHPDCCDD